MVRRKISRRGAVPTRRWPPGVPRLYPDLTDSQLAGFLSQEEYRRALLFPILEIAPFCDGERTEESLSLGLGVRDVLVRQLQLLQNVSVRGHEDSPNYSLDRNATAREDRRRNCFYLGGRVAPELDGFHISAYLLRTGSVVWRWEEVIPGVQPMIRAIALAVAAALRCGVDGRLEEKWRVGQPSDFESLIGLGKLSLTHGSERLSILAQLRRGDPSFVVPELYSPSKEPGDLLEAFEHDPYNAQVCFFIYLRLFKGIGPQPEVLQWARRGIELAPGHGKCHMVVPHASPNPADMLHHNELGYLLLPDNPYAVSNYAWALHHAKAPASRVVPLAEQAIELEPGASSPRYLLMEIHERSKHYDRALEQARAVFELFSRMEPQTRHWLSNFAVQEKLLESSHDFAQEAMQDVVRLERLVRGQNRKGAGDSGCR